MQFSLWFLVSNDWSNLSALEIFLFIMYIHYIFDIVFGVKLAAADMIWYAISHSLSQYLLFNNLHLR